MNRTSRGSHWILVELILAVIVYSQDSGIVHIVTQGVVVVHTHI